MIGESCRFYAISALVPLWATGNIYKNREDSTAHMENSYTVRALSLFIF